MILLIDQTLLHKSWPFSVCLSVTVVYSKKNVVQCNISYFLLQSMDSLPRHQTAMPNEFSQIKISPECTTYSLQYLQTVFGHTEFRPGQKEAIETIFSGEDTVVIIPTGGGKTAIYILPCIMTSGLAFVVSPLIMLMSDQVARLRQCGTTLMVAHFVFLNLASIHASL